nr:MAG TPA: hypothetical protein [Caudoviricetes sp.]
MTVGDWVQTALTIVVIGLMIYQIRQDNQR